MPTLIWIILSTIVLSAISLIGVVALFFREEMFRKFIFPLVSFSAGSLLGGALLHLIPEAINKIGDHITVFTWVIIGFALFFLLEQFIHWHHCHRAPSEHKHPVTYLVLFSDGLHNFLDGLAVGSAFVVDIHLGLITSLAVAMHEIPQELGDFGILVHGGWDKVRALLFNFLSGLTMVAGGLLAWLLAGKIEVVYLLPFAAGNFLYIAASDLIPEVKHSDNICLNGIHFFSFAFGIIFMYLLLLIG